MLDIVHLVQQLKAYPASRYLIGYSGGKDSHVLLDLLCSLRDSGKLNVPLAAIHVNHRFSEKSYQWAQHCRTICQAYKVRFTVETINTSPRAGESIEAFARTERYGLIEPHLLEGEIFLSAHHQRDQAETFLLQLMRGSGLDGLRAMPKIKTFGLGHYLRPLLATEYSKIEQYACEHKLHFVDDDSNADVRFSRNYIRHAVLPVIAERFPQAEKSIAQSAQWLSEVPATPIPKSLYISELEKLSFTEKKQQIRSYVKSKTVVSLSQTQTQYVLDNHLTAAKDKQPQLILAKKYVIRRYAGELLITELLPKEDLLVAAKTVVLNKDISVSLGKMVWHSGEGLSQDSFSELTVGLLATGQRFHPHNRQHSSTVNKLLHEAGVAPWIRPFCFGLFTGDDLVAIPMIGVDKKYYQKTTNARMPIWLIEEKFVKL